MPEPVLVPHAALAPGVCTLSGDFNGPFIDTQKSVRGHGRIYLAVKSLGPLIREAGWVPAAEVDEKLKEVEAAENSMEWDRERAALYDAIVQAVSPLLPEPEPIVKQVAVTNDKSLLTKIEKLESKIAGLKDALAAAQAPAPDAAEPAPMSEGSAPVERGSAATTVTVHGSEVDLDGLLGESVHTITSVVSGWPDDALEAVVLAEMERPQPRKTILGLVE